MNAQPESLKSTAQNTFAANPSSLALGVNRQTVISIQNHWREYYNPLRALDLPRAIALYDFSRRGLNAELQNCYREMEQLYPTLIGLIERRTSPLAEMEWHVKTHRPDQIPDGVSRMQCEDQAECLRTAYGNLDNIYDAIEGLAMASFRGYAHLEKVFKYPGTSDLTISHLEPVEQWHWTRKSMYSEWEYNVSATQTNVGVPINYDQWIIREVPRPLDRVALILWIRANLCEKDWDAFIEIYGIPNWVVTMPPNVPPEKEAEYLHAAYTIAQGGSGALPNGSDAKSAAQDTKGDIFRPRLDWLQEQLVLAGTGGLLSMLAMPTGGNSSQGSSHADAFAQISKAEARQISQIFNRQFDTGIINDNFPGDPALAWFELSAHEQTDVGAIVGDVLKLSQSGYQVSQSQIIEKTGYKVSAKPTPTTTTTPQSI